MTGPPYFLRFAAGRHAFPAAEAFPDGCWFVRGLGRTRMCGPGFWALLGSAMGISRVGTYTFTGT